VSSQKEENEEIEGEGVKKMKKFGKLYFSKSVEEGNSSSEAKTPNERKKLLRELSMDIHAISTGPGSRPHALIARGHQGWADVRAAVKVMGAVRRAQKSLGEEKKD